MAPEDASANADIGSCKIGETPAAGSAYASGLQYWPHGAVERLQFGNGLSEWTDYNNRLQPFRFRGVPEPL